MKIQVPTGFPACRRAVSRLTSLHSLSALLLYVCLSLWAQAVLAQAKYYVSATGNDGNAGTSSAQAFQSLGKVSSLPLQAGDSVFFKRGDTFRGTLQISRSGSAGRPVVFAAYGTGAKPVLSGSLPVTGWTRSAANANVWQTNCSACSDRVTGLHRSEVALPLGRYPNASAPNKGYLTIYSHNQKYQIVSVETLPLGFAGGEVAMRPTQWIIDRAVIDAQYDNALNLFNYSNYYPGDGWGFFIQNHPKTLDQQGEWAYTSSSKIISLFDSLASPNSQTITATVSQKGIDMYNVSNVVLRDIHLTENLATAVAVSNSSSFSLVNVDMVNSGEDGLIITGGGRDVLVDGCKLLNTNNNGIYIDNNYRDVILRNNTIRKVGAVPGRGKSGDGQYNAIQSAGEYVLMENNTIDSVGYNGITFWSNTTIQQNVISNYCMTKSDGGALYAWNGNKQTTTNIKLVSNIMFNGLGAPEGSFRREYSGANGIFLDDCMQDVEITDNTVFQNHQWGIYLHATNNVRLRGNTSFNNNTTQFTMYHDAGFCVMRDHVVQNNLFISREADQVTAQVESYADDLQQYGFFDNNYYAAVFDHPNHIQAVYNSFIYKRINLSEWQARWGHDLHSRETPISYPEYLPTGGEGTPKLANTFTASAEGWYTYSPYGNGQVVWNPSGQLDGGSLKIHFPTPSNQADSYQIATVETAQITQAQSYRANFDAVSTGPKTVDVYLRQKFAPYQELSQRQTLTIGTSRTACSASFVANASEPLAILVVQMKEDANPLYIDNLRLNEGTQQRLDPNEYVHIVYNPTRRDSVVTLTGMFRDVKNQRYEKSFTLKPYTSVVLIKDTLRPVDLRLSLQTNRRYVALNEDLLLSIRIVNDSPTETPVHTQWTCRLPSNMQVISTPPGVSVADGILTGLIEHLSGDSTQTVRLRPTVNGQYQLAGQIKTGLNLDPDSRPDSGTGDGEDDTAQVTFRVGDPGSTAVFASPNPNQLPLPPLQPNQPPVDPARTGWQLGLALSRRVVAANDTLTGYVILTNRGGVAASVVQMQVQLPTGISFQSSPGWTSNGALLNSDAVAVPAGASIRRSFKLKTDTSTQPIFVLKAQVFSSDKPDAYSTPGNGFLNGEEDTAQADLRIGQTIRP